MSKKDKKTKKEKEKKSRHEKDDVIKEETKSFTISEETAHRYVSENAPELSETIHASKPQEAGAPDCLKLENQLCFSLYACAKEVVRRYRPLLDPFDLTYTQYIVMMVLWEEKQINVKTLGEKLYLDSGTLTPLLKKLESKGYVKRERSLQDERNLNVSITEEGERLKILLHDVPGAMQACVCLEEKEAAELHRLLNKILKVIK